MTERHVLDERGLTIIELIVVVSIISILIVSLGFTFSGWRSRYTAEGEVRKLYSDIMGARAKAMQQKTVYFINMPASDTVRYLVYRDDDSDGTLGVWDSTDDLIVNTTLLYEINADSRQFTFSKTGMVNPNGDIWFGSEDFEIEDEEGNVYYADVDYSCIGLAATRVNTGWYNGTGCETK